MPPSSPRLWCTLCDALFDSEEQLNNHLNGKKHRKNLQKTAKEAAALARPGGAIVFLQLAEDPQQLMRQMGRWCIAHGLHSSAAQHQSVDTLVLQYMVRVACEYIPEARVTTRLAQMAVRTKTCPDCLRKQHDKDMQETIDGMSKKEVREAVERVGCDVEDLNELMADAIKKAGEAMKSTGEVVSQAKRLQQEQKDKLSELRMLQEAEEWWDTEPPDAISEQVDASGLQGFMIRRDPLPMHMCQPVSITCRCGLFMVLVVSKSAEWMPIGKKVLLCPNGNRWEKCGLVLPEEKWGEYIRRFPGNTFPPPPIFVYPGLDPDRVSPETPSTWRRRDPAESNPAESIEWAR